MFNYFVLLLVCDLKTTRVLLPAFGGILSNITVYSNLLVLLSTTVCSQNINKQNVNIADETLTDYSFLSRYYYTKSKYYLKIRYRIRH